VQAAKAMLSGLSIHSFSELKEVNGVKNPVWMHLVQKKLFH